MLVGQVRIIWYTVTTTHTDIFINPKRAKAKNTQRKERERASSTRRNQSRERGRGAGRGKGEEGKEKKGGKRHKWEAAERKRKNLPGQGSFAQAAHEEWKQAQEDEGCQEVA